MIEKAIRWIRDRYGATRITASSPDPVVSLPVDDASEARQKFADAFDSFSDFFRNIANDLQENTYLQQFITMGESFRKAGYWAGHWGVNDPNLEETAALHIRMTKSLINEKCRTNQQKHKTQIELLSLIKNNAKHDYKTKNGYYEKLNRAYQYSHRQFSLVLGFIYGFFSVVLVLA